ncbi:hypothetical protein LCGC14_2258670, partial [marine sediment metagenome]
VSIGVNNITPTVAVNQPFAVFSDDATTQTILFDNTGNGNHLLTFNTDANGDDATLLTLRVGGKDDAGTPADNVYHDIRFKTVLDNAGAEKLLGNGDMLFISSESSKPIRIQGAYITDDEVRDVVAFIVKHNEAQDSDDVNLEKQERGNLPTIMFEDYDDNGDELYDDALEVVRKARKASASLLQRRLRVGYARAARLLDIMEERGMVGPADGAKPREVYIVEDENEAA